MADVDRTADTRCACQSQGVRVMTDVILPADECTCRILGCGKNCAEGWRLCVDHVEAHMAARRCSHGNDDKYCVECLAEALRAESVTTPHQVPENELLALTARLDEHPEGWGYPCMCADCRSYNDG